MSPKLRAIMDEISRKLSELEAEYHATAPDHLLSSAGKERRYGRMINSRVRECRELYDWSIVARERIGGLVNLRTLGARYGVSYQTVYRYVDGTIGRSIPKGVLKWHSTRGAGRSKA